MNCPFCGHAKDRVVDSREGRDGQVVRRRRECLGCRKRFTTYERIDEIPFMVVKKDGRREPFDRHKILSGLLKACEKRPIGVPVLEKIVDDIETALQETPEREMPTSRIGARLMEKLKEIDQIAYVRFASVYREFKDLREFEAEIRNVQKAPGAPPPERGR
ncbi:MAG: transcriptional repressor NrdR [Acidobacteria bacterium]|nr:transcriptional repressor NrdR [Acidobacteriota bacterium]